MDQLEQAGACARTLFRAHELPALSFAVWSAGELRWQAALGAVDLELGVAATPQHLFRIGSVSKAVTATMAARLATRGLLDLDTPIAFWLPDLPRRHRATTLDQLLTHRGGIRHYIPRDMDPAQAGGSIFTRGSWTSEQMLDAFIHDELVSPPGATVSYSSWGYTLASLVIEAAAGSPFLTLVDELVATPFGLSSLVADRPAAVIPGRARGYVGETERMRLQEAFPDAGWPEAREGWGSAPPINPALCWAGGGLLMHAPDMARFGAMHLPGPSSAISVEERALLFTPRTEASDKSPPLGLGWRVDHDAQGRLRWHHAGSTPGGRASLVVYPDQGLSIALASNVMTAPGDVLGPSAQLADLFG